MKSVVGNGYMVDGSGSSNGETAGLNGIVFVTGGIAKIRNDANSPLTGQNALENYFPSDGSGSTTVNTSNNFVSARFVFVPVVSTAPYSKVTKAPDPLTAYDTSGGQPAPMVTATITLTSV